MNRHIQRLFILLLSVSCLTLTAPAQFGAPELFGEAAQAAEPEGPATTVELISDTASIQPGTPFDVGVQLTMEDKWHTYWKFGGDTDMPTVVNWELPKGFEAGEIQWPTPIRFLLEAGEVSLVGYGYEKKVVLVSTITPPADLDPETAATIELKATVEWLECDDKTCVPGDGLATLALPVKTAAPNAGKGRAAIAASKKTFPQQPEGWKSSWLREGENVVLEFVPPKSFGAIDADKPPTFYPSVPDLIDLGSTGDCAKLDNGAFALTFPPNQYVPETFPNQIPGILVGHDGAKLPGGAASLSFNLLEGSATTSTSKQASPDSAINAPGVEMEAASVGELEIDDPEGGKNISFGLAAFFFVIGGMLLNLMPCIFPVLAMKVMSFVKQAQEDATKAWQHGLVFGAGVLVSMWVIVAILLIARLIFPEREQTWSMLQNPYLVVALTLLFLVLAVNLFGVFEMGTSLTGVGGSSVGKKSGYSGSFFSGVLAVVVATPCTGPFLGAPIAFALSQESAIAMFILFSLFGLGIALPYILLSAFPPLLRMLPKPGPWMKNFKIIMGFIMLLVTATAAWVVIDLIPGKYTALKLGLGLVLTGFGWWLYGQNTKRAGQWGKMAFGLLLAILFTGGAYALQFAGGGGGDNPDMVATDGPPPATTNTVADVDGPTFTWKPWSPAAVAAARAAGRPVFIDYTATWCAICQANKPTMDSEEISELVDKKNVAMFRADYTKKDPVIAAELKKLGRAGVPAYPLYIPGGNKVKLLPSNLFFNKAKFKAALKALPDPS